MELHSPRCLLVLEGMAIYVNDCLTIGTDSAIDEVVESLKDYRFGLKVENYLADYLSCKIFQYINQGKAGSYKLIQFDIRGKVLEKISKT